MKKFVVKQSDAFFAARYNFPAFPLLTSAPNLHQHMLRNLGKYGLTLGDIRIEYGLPNLSEANARYSLDILNTVVRVWLDRLEVFFLDLTRVSEEQMLEIARTALNIVQHTVQDLQMETYTATLNLHGVLPDTEISQFFMQYVQNAPEGLGSVLGSGVVYYFGPEAERRSASLVIDMSATIPGAVLIRTSVDFDGTKLSRDQGPSAARDYVFKMLAGINLEPSWEK